MTELSDEARQVLETIREIVQELDDRREAVFQVDVNRRLDRPEDDAGTDAAVAELVRLDYIEKVMAPLPGMKGPASLRYRLWEGNE
jgi:hypothetical protein